MKRNVLYLLLGVSMLAIAGCSYKAVDITGYKMAQSFEQSIYNELSQETAQYLSGDLYVRESLSTEEPVIVISAEVIFPRAIPLVASEICDITANLLENDEYFSSYDISVLYMESNDGVADKDSIVQWHTTGGGEGMFLDYKNDIMGQYTIEELYVYFVDFWE